MTIQQYSTGVKLVIQFVDDNRVPIDISAATKVSIVYKKPSEEAAGSYWDAYFLTDGTDGKIYYRTLSEDDIDESGVWQLQGYYEDSTGHWHSTVTRITVRPSLMEMEEMVGTSIENLIAETIATIPSPGTLLEGRASGVTPIELLTTLGEQVPLERNATYTFEGVIVAQNIDNVSEIFTEYIEGTVSSGASVADVSIKGIDSRVRAGSTIDTVSTQQIEDTETGNIAFMFIGVAGKTFNVRARINILKAEE